MLVATVRSTLRCSKVPEIALSLRGKKINTILAVRLQQTNPKMSKASIQETIQLPKKQQFPRCNNTKLII